MTAPSLTARLFVTDVGVIPLRGETRVEQRANAMADLRVARRARRDWIADRFAERAALHLPAKADERLVAEIQSEIARMVAAGDLYAGRMGEMLASVGCASHPR